MVGPLAGVAKSSRDDMCDAGRLMALPPVTGDGYGTGREQDIDLSPLSYIPLKRGGELRFMGGIQYPAHLQAAPRLGGAGGGRNCVAVGHGPNFWYGEFMQVRASAHTQMRAGAHGSRL